MSYCLIWTISTTLSVYAALNLLILLLIVAAFSLLYIYFRNRYHREKIKSEITAREAILKERNQLRTLIDAIPDMIFIKDRDGRFVMGNKKAAAVLGVKQEELVGKTDFDIYANDLAARFYEDEQKIMQTGEPMINYEEPCLDEQGNRIIIATTKVPLKNINGEVYGIVGICRDITRLKRTELQLRRKTEDLQETNTLLEERQQEILMQSEELVNQTQNLRIINEELELLNRTKDKFFSIIAHDLRNPFNAIIGFSELLRKDYYEMDHQQRIGLLELINASSESAFNLLENLLQWARTQTNRIKFNPEDFDILDIFQSVSNLYDLVAHKKNLRILNEIEPLTRVYADKNMVNTIARNLISNAIKFSKTGGEIKISSKSNGEMVEISVHDSGIGISKENLNKLFRIDTYHSTSGTLGETGTGLGLIICKEFIEKNNGRIKVASKEGTGTTLSFTLNKGSGE
jgi:PAS domain S-box-containing protein